MNPRVPPAAADSNGSEQSARDRKAVWRPRVTVASIIEDGGKFLLVEERIHGELLLNQPAGHLEPGESLVEAAIREAFEETGWEIRPIGLIGIYQWCSPRSGDQYLRVAFRAEAVAHDAAATLDAGIVRALWLAPHEIDNATHRPRSPLVLRNIEDALRRPPLPLDALYAFDLGVGATAGGSATNRR